MAVYRVLYQSILNAKLTGRKNLGRKRCTSNRDDLKLENTVKQADSNTWESFTRSGLKLESVHQSHHAQTSSGKGLPSHFWTRENVQKHLTWLWRKRTGLLLSGPKSSFQMKVNFAFHLEIKVPESGGRVERHRIHVAWSPVEVSTVSDDLGCHVICWCWSTVFSEVHSQRSHLPGNFRALHASFCWQALWRRWFNFPAGLGTCPHCQRYQKLVQWPWCYCAWLASKLSPDLNPIENLWGIVKRKMRDTRPNNADDLKATVKETWASIPPQQCHKLITSMPRRIEAVIKAKEPLPSIEYIYSKWTYFPEGQQFTKMFFLLVLWSILICWDMWLVGFC